MPTPQEISAFQKMLFTWWKGNRRDLPWRYTDDPYKILISEVMLQQTQVVRVVQKWVEFTRAYPSVQNLSQASKSEVLRLWKGMGYNRRALYLRAAAKKIVEEFGGIFPKAEADILMLPGVGIYTARAVMVFAFRAHAAPIDTNIRRIILHHFFANAPQSEAIIQQVAEQLVPRGNSWEWHQAMMDYGALGLERTKGKFVTPREPYRGSNRFYRGRIIDLLRDKSLERSKLVRTFAAEYGKDPVELNALISKLVDEGLAQKKGRRIQLPS